MEEVDDDDDNLTSTFRRQRQFVASAKDSLFADQLLRAQKEEGEEKLDVNFTLAFDRLAPAGANHPAPFSAYPAVGGIAELDWNE